VGSNCSAGAGLPHFIFNLEEQCLQQLRREIVAMMQASKPWYRFDSATRFSVTHCFAPSRCSLRQHKMSSVFVIVNDVLIHQTFQMPLIENDHMVEEIRRQLPTQRSATPFCHGLRKLVRLA